MFNNELFDKDDFKKDCISMNMNELSEKYGCSWSKISKMKIEFGCVGLRKPKMWGDKISAKNKGRIITSEWRRNLSLGGCGVKKGYVWSEEHNKNVSLARKGMKFTDEHKKNIGIASSKRTGWRWSSEMKKKLSVAAAKKHMAGNDRRKKYGTPYHGVIFMNVWEAKVAARLDDIGVTWEYESHAFDLPSGRIYIPDFKVGNKFIEVRFNGTSDRWKKVIEFRSLGHELLIVTDPDSFDWMKEVV